LSIVDPADKRAFSAIQTSLQKAEPKDFPVEMSFYNEVKRRVNLARKLDKVMHQIEQATQASSWLKKQAEDAELEVDEDLLPDLEEQKLPRYKRIQLEQTISTLRGQLNELLDAPLLPAGSPPLNFHHLQVLTFFLGASRSYITKNPLPTMLGETESHSAHKDVKSSTKSIFKFKQRRGNAKSSAVISNKPKSDQK